MATYIVLGNFTDQGIRNVKETAMRAEAFKALAKKAGVTVKDMIPLQNPTLSGFTRTVENFFAHICPAAHFIEVGRHF